MLLSVPSGDHDIEVLVTNTSPDVELPLVTEGCRVFKMKNRGYAAGVNRALAVARGEVLVICNADIVIPPGVIEGAVEFLGRNEDVGVVAPRLVNADGSSQNSARRFYSWRAALWARCPLRKLLGPVASFRRYLMMDEAAEGPRDVDWAIGAMFVVRRAALSNPDEVFDPRYCLYMEDVDLCLDMWRNGWRVVQLPGLDVTHTHRRASGRVFSRAGLHHFASFLKFVLKHGGLPQRVA